MLPRHFHARGVSRELLRAPGSSLAQDRAPSHPPPRQRLLLPENLILTRKQQMMTSTASRQTHAALARVRRDFCQLCFANRAAEGTGTPGKVRKQRWVKRLDPHEHLLRGVFHTPRQLRTGLQRSPGPPARFAVGHGWALGTGQGSCAAHSSDMASRGHDKDSDSFRLHGSKPGTSDPPRNQAPGSKKPQDLGAAEALPAQASLPSRQADAPQQAGRCSPRTQRFPVPTSPRGSRAGLRADDGCTGQVTKYCQTQATKNASADGVSASSRALRNPRDQIRTWRPHPGAKSRGSTRQPANPAALLPPRQHLSCHPPVPAPPEQPELVGPGGAGMPGHLGDLWDGSRDCREHLKHTLGTLCKRSQHPHAQISPLPTPGAAPTARTWSQEPLPPVNEPSPTPALGSARPCPHLLPSSRSQDHGGGGCG